MNNGAKNILVVEDERRLRELAGRFLKKAGYNVTTAGDGEEALKLYLELNRDFHLLLTDIVMPGMSGKELADELDKISPELKVLFMSGYTDDIILSHGVSQKDTHFLAKPFTSAALLETVRAVLDE